MPQLTVCRLVGAMLQIFQCGAPWKLVTTRPLEVASNKASWMQKMGSVFVTTNLDVNVFLTLFWLLVDLNKNLCFGFILKICRLWLACCEVKTAPQNITVGLDSPGVVLCGLQPLHGRSRSPRRSSWTGRCWLNRTSAEAVGVGSTKSWVGWHVWTQKKQMRATCFFFFGFLTWIENDVKAIWAIFGGWRPSLQLN